MNYTDHTDYTGNQEHRMENPENPVAAEDAVAAEAIDGIHGLEASGITENLEDLADLDDLEDLEDLDDLENLDDLNALEGIEELENPEELDDPDASEEPENLEDLDDLEAPEEPENLEDLDDLEASEEPENLEDLDNPVSSEESGNIEGLDDSQESLESVESGDSEDAGQKAARPACPEAAIEAILFASGGSVGIERLSSILSMEQGEVREAIARLQAGYAREERGIMITELEDAVQLGTKGEYYGYLMQLAKHPKQYSLSDTVIETLSIIAYKQPVTRAQIEQIRGVSCDHALNRLLEYDLVEEVGRLDAPGRPLQFGTTEQFLRSFGVRSLGELPTLSPEMVENFKLEAEAEAAENLKVEV